MFFKCKDNFSMSVIAHECAYCQPRDNTGPYFKLEIGFPNQEEQDLKEYAEDWDKPTNTVYGYVPIDVIVQVIEKHGGLDPESIIQNVVKKDNPFLRMRAGEVKQ